MWRNLALIVEHHGQTWGWWPWAKQRARMHSHQKDWLVKDWNWLSAPFAPGLWKMRRKRCTPHTPPPPPPPPPPPHSGIYSSASGTYSGGSGIYSDASGIYSGASGIYFGGSGTYSGGSGTYSGVPGICSGGSGTCSGVSGTYSGGSGIYSGGTYSGGSGICSGGSGICSGASGICSGTSGTCSGTTGTCSGGSGTYSGGSGICSGAAGIYSCRSGTYSGASGIYSGASGICSGGEKPKMCQKNLQNVPTKPPKYTKKKSLTNLPKCTKKNPQNLPKTSPHCIQNPHPNLPQRFFGKGRQGGHSCRLHPRPMLQTAHPNSYHNSHATAAPRGRHSRRPLVAAGNQSDSEPRQTGTNHSKFGTSQGTKSVDLKKSGNNTWTIALRCMQCM